MSLSRKQFIELDRVVENLEEQGVLTEVGFSDFAALCSEALWVDNVTQADYNKWVAEDYLL